MSEKPKKPKKCLNCGKPCETDFCSKKCITKWGKHINPLKSGNNQNQPVIHCREVAPQKNKG